MIYLRHVIQVFAIICLSLGVSVSVAYSSDSCVQSGILALVPAVVVSNQCSVNTDSGRDNLVQLAQSCPAPDAGQGFCGEYGGSCWYCDADTPHFCPGSKKCYQYFTGAQADCGNNYVICGTSR